MVAVTVLVRTSAMRNTFPRGFFLSWGLCSSSALPTHLRGCCHSQQQRHPHLAPWNNSGSGESCFPWFSSMHVHISRKCASAKCTSNGRKEYMHLWYDLDTEEGIGDGWAGAAQARGKPSCEQLRPPASRVHRNKNVSMKQEAWL